MARRSRQNPAVREYILRNVEKVPTSLTSSTAAEFGLSRAAINRYVNRLIDEGLIEATGNTRARRYSLRNIVSEYFTVDGISKKWSSEDTVWRGQVRPLMKDLPQNIIDVCHYGFTEIFNNVIDHSASVAADVLYEQTHNKVSIIVDDSGIGIFQKIQNDFDLPDARSALLELSKGKLTSDKEHHAGQGIFFTSRMFNRFSILSGNLFYIRLRTDDEGWLIETGDRSDPIKGTRVRMEIETDADWTPREIFDRFQGSDISFLKTHVPVKLSQYPGEQLVSRSQAKRVLARFDQFTEVMLDFEGVNDIGQPFADEIFRVFPLSHPDIVLQVMSANKNVSKMIAYTYAQAKDD
jgi:anti-sigma regulatory factor (Ser/Thr protein kinase)